jgi:hypothetical protein
MGANIKMLTALKDCENAADDLCRTYLAKRHSQEDITRAEDKFELALDKYKRSCEACICGSPEEKRDLLKIFRNANFKYAEGKRARILLDDGLYPWNRIDIRCKSDRINIYFSQRKNDPMHGHLILSRHSLSVEHFRAYGYGILKTKKKTA